MIEVREGAQTGEGQTNPPSRLGKQSKPRRRRQRQGATVFEVCDGCAGLDRPVGHLVIKTLSRHRMKEGTDGRAAALNTMSCKMRCEGGEVARSWKKQR